MRSCDLLIANLTPFRGVSMDSGTAFEVGFMRALGRPVLGYTTATDTIGSARRPIGSATHCRTIAMPPTSTSRTSTRLRT